MFVMRLVGAFALAEGDEEAFVRSWREEGGPPLIAPARPRLWFVSYPARRDGEPRSRLVVIGPSWLLKVWEETAPSLPDDRPKCPFLKYGMPANGPLNRRDRASVATAMGSKTGRADLTKCFATLGPLSADAVGKRRSERRR